MYQPCSTHLSSKWLVDSLVNYYVLGSDEAVG